MALSKTRLMGIWTRHKDQLTKTRHKNHLILRCMVYFKTKIHISRIFERIAPMIRLLRSEQNFISHLIFLEWFNFLIARNLTYMILIREKQGPHSMTRLFLVYSSFIPRLFGRGGTINATLQTPYIL